MKKKAYLYLGLLGVGLMIGSLTALINRSVGGTYASDPCDNASSLSETECASCGYSWNSDNNKCTVPLTPNMCYGVTTNYDLCQACKESGGSSWNDTDACCVGVDSGCGGGTTPSYSGFYYLKNGVCTAYPEFPSSGYCIEEGTQYLHYPTDPYSDCTESKSLSCEAIYIANNYPGGVAQAVLFGAGEHKTLYNSSDCSEGSIISTSAAYAEAQAWCNSTTNFGTIGTLTVGQTITVTDQNGVLSSFTNVYASDDAITVTRLGNNLTITANSVTDGTNIIFTKGDTNNKTELFSAFCSSDSQDYVTFTGKLPYVVDSISVVVTDNVVPSTKGNLKVVKSNEKDESLANVKFKIGTDLNGNENTDWKYYETDTNGEILITDIEVGTTIYYQEVDTLEGYKLDTTSHNIVISSGVNLVSIINEKMEYGKLKIIKTNENDEFLSTVKFKIGTDLNGNENTDWKYYETDTNGEILITDIEVGTTIYYQEIKTLDGYYLDSEIKSIMIDTVGEPKVVNIKNYRTSITINKIDSSNKKALASVILEIYDLDDKLLYTGSTNKDGKLVIQGIENGKYYAKEKEAPDGYLLNKDKHYFEISDSNKNVVITIKNVPDNPDTGSIFIYTTMIIGAICLGVSIYQYKRLKNVEFM